MASYPQLALSPLLNTHTHTAHLQQLPFLAQLCPYLTYKLSSQEKGATDEDRFYKAGIVQSWSPVSLGRL